MAEHGAHKKAMPKTMPRKPMMTKAQMKKRMGARAGGAPVRKKK